MATKASNYFVNVLQTNSNSPLYWFCCLLSIPKKKKKNALDPYEVYCNSKFELIA